MKIRIVGNSERAITPDCEYEVLEIDIGWKPAAGELVHFRVIGDNGSIEYVPITNVMPLPCLAQPDIHKFLAPLPDNWVVYIHSGIICTIGSQELSREGYREGGFFWEDFFDDLGSARSILSRMLKQKYPESYSRFRKYYGDPTEAEPLEKKQTAG